MQKLNNFFIQLNETKHKTAFGIQTETINHRIIYNASWIFVVHPFEQYLYGIYENLGFKV